MKSAIKIIICILCLFSFAYARQDNKTYTDYMQATPVWMEPRNIKVYVEESPKKHILLNAFNIWDKALRSDLNFKFVNSLNQADISIGYVEKISGNAVGLTYPNYLTIQGKEYLYKAKVQISKTDPVGFIQNDAALLKVALHEIGHAIGIIGHSNSINDIMYYSTASTKNTSPSLRDIDTINKLYGF